MGMILWNSILERKWHLSCALFCSFWDSTELRGFSKENKLFYLIRIYIVHFLQTTIHRHITNQSLILKWISNNPPVCKSQRGNPTEVFPRLRCYFNSNWYRLQWELYLTYRPSLEPQWGLSKESKSTYWLRRFEWTFCEQRNDSAEDNINILKVYIIYNCISIEDCTTGFGCEMWVFLKFKQGWQICLICLIWLPNSVKIKNPLNISKLKF